MNILVQVEHYIWPTSILVFYQLNKWNDIKICIFVSFYQDLSNGAPLINVPDDSYKT
jgi:hypothetical protein